MATTATVERERLMKTNLIRVTGTLEMYLPFGLGIVFPTHWTYERTTIHQRKNCRHCHDKRIEVRDCSAHVGMRRRGETWETQILMLPPLATQTLIDSCDREALRNTALELKLTRSKDSKRSTIACNVKPYECRVGTQDNREACMDSLVRVMWDRLYDNHNEPDEESLRNIFTRLI